MSSTFATLGPVLPLALPATLALTALLSPRRAGLASALALVLAVLVCLAAASGDPAGSVLPCVMLLLVTSLGAVIVRYSRSYLHGDPGLPRYLRWLLLTLAAVTALIIANNLLAIALGWTATSLALHQLLTFQRDRPAALVAAHKKFLVSRLADGCLLACLCLVHRDIGSFELDQIGAWALAHPALTPSLQLAAVLLVIAVALRSAQLPFHGWLLQVMEAPTPVSALLHAGVVNIGGFVLLRLAPWLAHAPVAQGLLVGIGMVSAAVAALVMTTRVSVKVALAWSTCAQMGFMLVECGLGLWHVALLHLVAHSLYKAHAFLSTGTAVDAWRRAALMAPPPRPSWARLGIATGAALGLGALGCVATRDPFAILVGLATVPLLVRRPDGPAGIAAGAARAGGVAVLYAGWHLAAASVMSTPAMAVATPMWALVGAGFAGLFAVQAAVLRAPDGRLADALYPWLFAGFYIDDCFTRLAFAVWPPRLQPRAAGPRPQRPAEPLEAGV